MYVHVCIHNIHVRVHNDGHTNTADHDCTFANVFNSLHATDLYIDFMNNSLAKKEIMKRKKKERKKVTEPGYELKTNL